MRATMLAVTALSAAVLAVGQAEAARPATTLEITHFFRGCHVFTMTETPTVVVRLQKGDRIRLVNHDVMDFDLTQTAGPTVALGDPRLRRSESRMLAFRKSGVYRFEGKNVQTSEEVGVQTLGPDNTLKLTVRVA